MIATMTSGTFPIGSIASPNSTCIGWEAIRGGRVFVTGGSGFFGRAFLELLSSANRQWDLQTRAVILTRDADRFRRRLPHLAGEANFSLQIGDVRVADLPKEPCTHLVHLAGEPHGPTYAADPTGMVNAMVSGAKRTLEIARECGIRRALLVSTGAVYGPQPDLEFISENAPPNEEPSVSRRAYASGKRIVEDMFLSVRDLEVVIARPFAFLGPGLLRETTFAASQFLKQAFAGGPIQVLHGNVTRSYLYSTDLAEWLWTFLLRGLPGQSYNVGSETPVTLAELARLIALQFQPAPRITILADGPKESYLPSTLKAREAFALKETVGLEEAVRATVAWHRTAVDVK